MKSHHIERGDTSLLQTAIITIFALSLLSSNCIAQESALTESAVLLALQQRQEEYINELEGELKGLRTRVAALEVAELQRKLPADTRIYDGYITRIDDERTLLAFYNLESFDATISGYEILDGGKAEHSNVKHDSIADVTLTDGPILRVFISANGKTIVLNNFKVLGGSIATLDDLIKQPSCKLPHELWRMRYSALYD